MKTQFKFIALLFTAIIFISITANAQWIKPSGNTISETRNLDSFHSIHSSSSADIMISQGNTQKVVVESDANLVPHIKTYVSDGVLKIEIKKNFKNIDELTIYITVPDLNKISVSGSGDIKVNKFKSTELIVKISGSGDFYGDLDLKKLQYKVSGSGDGNISGVTGELEIGISGSGDIKATGLRLSNCSAKVNGSGDMNLSGKTENLSIAISGSGDIHAYGLEAVNVTAKIAGSGDIEITAIENISASIAGSGDVYYKGNPNQSKVSASGSGDLIRR